MSDVFLFDAVRTPFGKYGGALAGTRPDDLAALVVRTLVERSPQLDPSRVDEVVLGNANGAGEDNRNVARMAGLLAGLPTSVPAAWESGFYADQVVAVPGVDLTRDESIRPDTTPEKLAGWGAAANEPQFFGFAPVEAANTALKRAGIGWGDVGAVELNEAFAAQSLACIRAWNVDPAVVNRHGGAIAIGHPLGASGTRILGTLARTLTESGERWGVAAICIGVGQGLAVVLENLSSARGA
jgi:acetyl-CoA acetyltransferase